MKKFAVSSLENSDAVSEFSQPVSQPKGDSEMSKKAREQSQVEVSKPKKLAKVPKSKDNVAQWLTGVPKSSSTPLETIVEATTEVAWAINNSFEDVPWDELLESLLIILDVMHKSAGVKYPEDMDRMSEAPTEEQVKRAYDALHYVVREQGAFDYLVDHLKRAMDVIDEWRRRCGHDC